MVEKQPSRKFCEEHPRAVEGSCGFYPGREHGWRPDQPSLLAIQHAFSEKMERERIFIYEGGVIKSEARVLLESHEVRNG